MNNRIWTATCSVLAVALGGSLYYNHVLSDRLDEMSDKLLSFKNKDGKSYVVERISKQMEDIAYQQKEISDKQREKAIFQMGVAENMRKHAERERKYAEAEKARADKEKDNANEYAAKATEARDMAERQRKIAEHQQMLAEQSKNTADTLRYRALGRSLASISMMQLSSGNKSLAALLAYNSWKFTSEYGGNTYFSAIYNALSMNSGNFFQKKIMKGGVMRIAPVRRGGNTFISVSKYGEISKWTYSKNASENNTSHINGNTILANPIYDFRDLYVDKYGTGYVADFNGMLFIVNADNSIVKLPIRNGARLSHIRSIGGDKILLASDTHYFIFDTASRRIESEHTFPKPISCLDNIGQRLYAFSDTDGLWEVLSNGKLRTVQRLVNQKVTAVCWSPIHKKMAVGTETGCIFIIDSNLKASHFVASHQSAITSLAFDGPHLLSGCLDGKLNMFNIEEEKDVPLNVRTYTSWIHCLTLSADHTVWVGDESGTVSRIELSPKKMAETIYKKLDRDLTDREWNYYIGGDAPRYRLNKQK